MGRKGEREKKNKNSPKDILGFTLIELLVIISIIGLLSSAAVFALNNARIKARDAKRAADLKQVQKALELYFDNHNAYPTLGTSWSCSCPTGNCISGHTWYTALKPLVDEGLLPFLPSDPVNEIRGSEYYCYEYSPPTFTSSWYCNGIRRTDYEYALFFSAEGGDFDLPRVTDSSGNPLAYYDYCILGPLK
ncbi:MAG: type II secretion system protein [Patescibacteria group bacterium]|nr:type II secretion system protein [Patescibacteria group bacterium]